GRVVGPDGFLVRKERRVLLGNDHRMQPGVLVARRRRNWIVGSGYGDRFEALECRIAALGAEVDCQVGVVEARPVRPREFTVGARTRAEGERRIAVRDKPILVIPRQRADRTELARARCWTEARAG